MMENAALTANRNRRLEWRGESRDWIQAALVACAGPVPGNDPAERFYPETGISHEELPAAKTVISKAKDHLPKRILQRWRRKQAFSWINPPTGFLPFNRRHYPPEMTVLSLLKFYWKIFGKRSNPKS